MPNTRIVTFLFLITFLSGCPKKHSPIDEVEDPKPLGLEAQGGAGGMNQGGTGGEGEPNPSNHPQMVDRQEPERAICLSNDQIRADLCGNIPVIEPIINQISEKHWNFEICAGISHAIQTSCERHTMPETVVAWTAPLSGQYNIYSSEFLSNIAIRTNCINPQSEIECQLSSSQLQEINAQAGDTFFLILQNNDEASHKINIYLTGQPEPPQILAVQEDPLRYAPRRYSPQIEIFAQDPNNNIVAFQYEYLAEENVEPLAIYTQGKQPHEYGNSIYLDDKPYRISERTNPKSLFRSKSNVLPTDAMFFRVRAMDATGLLSEFTDPISLYDIPFYQISQFENEPCTPHDESIEHETFTDLFCQRSHNEPTHSWKAKYDFLGYCNRYIEVESSHVFLNGNRIGIEAVVQTHLVETLPSEIDLANVSTTDADSNRSRIINEKTPLHLEVSRISEDQFRLRQSWVLAEEIENLTATFSVGAKPSLAECTSEREMISAEEYPRIQPDQECDPTYATNLCIDNYDCVEHDLGFTCQAFENAPLPQITNAHRSFLEEKYQPYLESVRAGLHVTIEDPQDLFINLHLKEHISIEQGQERVSIRTIPTEELRILKTGDQYEIQFHQDYPFPLNTGEYDPRSGPWFIQVLDCFGRSGPWIEVAEQEPQTLTENSECSLHNPLSTCEQGAFCNPDPANGIHFCQRETTPEIQSVEAFFHAPLIPEENVAYASRFFGPSRTRLPQLFVQMEGTSNTPIQNYKVEVQILNEQDAQLIRYNAAMRYIKYSDNQPNLNQALESMFDENGNMFNAQWHTSINTAAPSSIDRYATALLTNTFPTIEEIEHAFENTRLQIRMIKENGNHSNWFETPILPLPKRLEGEICEQGNIASQRCEEHLVCASSNLPQQSTCTDLNALETSCPADWEVISLNDFRDPPEQNPGVDSSWTQQSQFELNLEYSPNTCSQSVSQKVYAFMAPGNLAESTLFQIELQGTNKAFSIRRSCQWIESESACEIDCKGENCDYIFFGDHVTHTIANVQLLNPGEIIYIFPTKQFENGNNIFRLQVEPFVPSQVLLNDPDQLPIVTSEVFERTNLDGETTEKISIQAKLPIHYGSLDHSVKNRFTARFELFNTNGDLIETVQASQVYDFAQVNEENIINKKFSAVLELPAEDRSNIETIRIFLDEKQIPLDQNPLEFEVTHLNEE